MNHRRNTKTVEQNRRPNKSKCRGGMSSVARAGMVMVVRDTG